MKNNKRKRIILLLMAAAMLVILFAVLFWHGSSKKPKQVKIGFVMSGSVEEVGWNGMHYEGVKQACKELNAELLIKENIAEYSGQCEPAVRELVKEGARMIILSSYGYSKEVAGLVKEYPDIVFYTNSSELHDTNMTAYFVQMYQARYLAGIVAGMRTQTDKIGYVAAMANNEVNRGISAFTLGVRRVNPAAEVIVTWTDSWDNESKEKKAAEALVFDCDVDVLTCHQNRPYVLEAAEALGIDSIGYHEGLKDASEHCLTTVCCDWKLVYEEIIRKFMQGKGNATENFWIGMEENAVGLQEFSSLVTEEIKQEVKLATEEILFGKDVFSDAIYDREGELKCREGEAISDEMLLEQFDWYVEGVEFYEDNVERTKE